MNSSLTSPIPWGALWVCGHFGWRYLPPPWKGRCSWGWPYIPTTIYKTLPQTPHSWPLVKSLWGRVRRTPSWFSTVSIFSPQPGAIIAESHIEALATHIEKALNDSHNSINLLNQETAQICTAILQNKMVLDLLTAAQGGV